MIRVFLLGVLGLIALTLVARNLPNYEARTTTALTTKSAGDDSAPFARWDGVWEGKFVSRRPDGSVVETTKVRQEYASINPGQQNVTITDQRGSGPAIISKGVNRSVPGGLECLVTDPNGATKLLAGRREGGVIYWHRTDKAKGIEESFREEILSLPEGDLYTIDGFGIYGVNSGNLILFEGRYRRVGNTGR